MELCRDKSLCCGLRSGDTHTERTGPYLASAQLRVATCNSSSHVSLYEFVLGNNAPIGSGDINNVCGEAHKCKLEFSSVVFVLNHLDETILKALSFPWHLE